MTFQTSRIYRAAKHVARHAAARAIRAGAHPAWFRYRIIETEELDAYAQRRRKGGVVSLEIVHPPDASEHPLPRNIDDRCELPADRGWWGYSFRDVPERQNGRTVVARLSNCRVVPWVDARKEFWVTLLNEDGRALRVREMALRSGHRDVLRHASTRKIDEAVWILERVFHNYSHWFTAHMPKLLLLRERGLAEQVLLPEVRPEFIDDSLRLFGFDPDSFPTFDPRTVLQVRRLITMDSDRFRPELLDRVRAACPRQTQEPVFRRVYISRRSAARRRLINEEEIWPELAARGFERVRMEELSLAGQVRLMQETAVVCAPHGAGLTNMMFCPPRTQVIELADLEFPNPNFYAVASAMQHDYWLVPAQGVGDVHPLEKDMWVDPDRLRPVLDAALSRTLVAQ